MRAVVQALLYHIISGPLFLEPLDEHVVQEMPCRDKALLPLLIQVKRVQY